MPLIKIEKINTHRYLGFWKTEESFDDLIRLLSPNSDDLALVNGFKNDQKKLEWVTGRLTTKALVEHIGLTYHGLIKDSHGKPFLNEHKHHISITNSHPYIAVILDSENSVGVDLEKATSKLIRVQHKFLNPQEVIDTNNDIKMLCIYWCAKEALYKVHGRKNLSFKENIYISPFHLNETRGVFNGKIIATDRVISYQLEYRIEDNYIIAFNID